MALAARDGVPVSDVLVADASRRTTALNAYVSGLGPDPADRRLRHAAARGARRPRCESVVAHELGHAKDRDVRDRHADRRARRGRGGRARSTCSARWAALLRRAGVDSIAEPRAIGLLLAAGHGRRAGRRPGAEPVSRRIEARADAHALALTGDPAAFEAMQRRLADVNLADPDPPRAGVPAVRHPSVHRGADRPARRAAPRPAGRAPMSRTLLVTNDFPPRPGGIQ